MRVRRFAPTARFVAFGSGYVASDAATPFTRAAMTLFLEAETWTGT